MKKMLLIIGAIILLAGVLLTYCYFTPVIILTASRPADDDTESYVCRPMLALSEKLGLPLPPNKRAQIKEFAEKTDDIVREIHDDYIQPMQIDVAVEVVKGRTVITYAGTVTEKNGTTVAYEKQLILDFVLTRDIR